MSGKKLSTLLFTIGVLALAACSDGNNDLVGVEFMPTMEAATDDLDEFWDEFLAEHGFGRYYRSPRDVTYYQPDVPEETPCGDTIPNNAFYCSADNSIYFDEVFLKAEFDKGVYSPVYIAAHEWGHLVQQDLGILEGLSFTIQTELQADCFAGLYTRDVDDREFITTVNLLEAVSTLIQVGDPAIIPWWFPGAHGEPAERVAAFTLGYTEGWDACLRDPFIAPRVESNG